MENNDAILISRIDSIGDVVLTLPLCGWLKDKFPKRKIIFMGNAYTKSVLECYPFIDEIIDWFEIEKLRKIEQIEFFIAKNIHTCLHIFPNKKIARVIHQAGIAERIGTSHRFFHLFTCNIRLNFSRKHSELHESQLNFELLRPLGLDEIPKLSKMQEYLATFRPKDCSLPVDILGDINVILHPKSKGSAVEWPIFKYVQLAEKLADLGCHVYFTGTENEALYFRDKIPSNPLIHDYTGKFTLREYISFISHCDGIVACSTGPLHLGAILGLKAVGIYSQTAPIHPARWRPLGEKVLIVTNSKEPIRGKINPSFVQQISVDTISKQFK